jgi:2',3'-cyclic-nucleotide 2'-phosphodiesterase (5'-nucleotidase family)
MLIFDTHPPTSPQIEASIVTNMTVMTQAGTYGSFFNVTVFAFKSIDIFHSIVESKKPIIAATNTPVFIPLARVAITVLQYLH